MQKLTICLLAALVAVSCAACGLLIAFVTRNYCAGEFTGEVKNGASSIMTSTPPVSDDKPASPYDAYRLPRHILPSAYQLNLQPDLDKGVFRGTNVITVNVSSPAPYFVIHEKDLNITSTQVRRGGTGQGEVVPVKAAFTYPKNEFWVIEFASPVDPGSYTVRLEFNGSLVNGILGFYKSEYFNEITGQKSAMAATKFEPTNARRAFPCFDEPNMKATFDVSIVHEREFIALSNMPSTGQQTLEDGLLETQFEKSVAMPTYLVCFIVCDFKHKTVTTQDGKPFSVYATPNQINNVDYALNAGRLVQNYYSEYYGIPYPLPKQDMIAVPDFVSGAMEHWGLVTYRETALLFDPKESPIQSQERVATVIAHELAHQWFGNLVTMDWWDDLWLNEGFASYVEYIGAGLIEPTWNMPEDIVVSDLQNVMEVDAGSGSHPIIQPVNNPDEITEIFDAISYSKGCSVLRMLDSFMENDDFRKGLQSYLKRYSYGNAKTKDLWDELTKASSKNLNIAIIMDTWTKQMGFPVIHVSRDPTKPSTFTATQQRFFLLPDAAQKIDRSESPFGYLWHVPLSYRMSDGSVATTWMNGVEKLTFEIPSAADFVKLNVDQTGYYKVNYDDDTWTLLSHKLRDNHRNFSRPDRANLLDDALTLASGGYLNYSIALNVTKYLVKETDYLPWASVTKDLYSISNLLQSTDAYQAFRHYILNLATPLYNSLGWKDEGDHLSRQGILQHVYRSIDLIVNLFSYEAHCLPPTKKLRSLIITTLCNLDHNDCLMESERQLKAWINGEFVPPNFRRVVYRYGISGSQGPDVWDAVWNKYLNTSLATEKMLLLYGLSYAKDPWLINRYLEYAGDEKLIRRQDYFLVLTYIADNPLGRGILWDFYRKEYSKLVERFTLNDRGLGKIIIQITNGFAEDFRLQEMTDFFAKYPDAGAGARARTQALERVKQNIDWLKRYKETIKTWLQENV